MPRIAAGLLMYRHRRSRLEFLLVHPGGPFAKKDDAGAWGIPKGEPAAGEDLPATARREFTEETGHPVPADAKMIALTPIRQKGGKVVHAWAFEGDCDPALCRSNEFEMEWPPHSGRLMRFPEADRAAFFDLLAASQKLKPAQMPLLEELAEILARRPGRHPR